MPSSGIGRCPTFLFEVIWLHTNASVVKNRSKHAKLIANAAGRGSAASPAKPRSKRHALVNTGPTSHVKKRMTLMSMPTTPRMVAGTPTKVIDSSHQLRYNKHMTNKQKRIVACILLIVVLICIAILSLPFYQTLMMCIGGWQVGTWTGSWCRAQWPNKE